MQWDNRKGIPCLEINKTPNTSNILREVSINKIIIDREKIDKSGAVDVVDILNYIDGINLNKMGKEAS